MHILPLIIINFILTENILGKLRQHSPTVRIIGGNAASIQNYPFVASIILKFHENNTIFSGGASIIAKSWVITAAHCVYDFYDGILSSKQAFVRTNTSYWIDDLAFSRDHLIIEYVIHYGYISEKEDYDIALLHVQDAFDGKFATPIAYANKHYKYEDDSGAITFGWGTTQANVEPHTVRRLRKVEIRLMKPTRCTEMYNKYNISTTRRMICAGAPGKDTCVNDSGGPLIQYKDNDNATLIGIVSWGVECASDEFPGVFTKVSEFDEWIADRIHHNHQHDDIPYNSYSDEMKMTKIGDVYDDYDI